MTSSRMLVAPMAATVLALGLLGCSGADGPVAPEPSLTTPTASPGAPTPSAPAVSYLPVPDGVTLTEPGTALTLRRKATGAWEPRQDLVGVLSVKVTRIEVTSVAKALSGFDLEPTAAALTPYFVTAKVTNVGASDLGGRTLPLYVVDGDQALVAPTGVDPGFELCPGSTLPAIFAPGDTAQSCLIFLVDPEAELDAVMFRPPEGVVPITWTGKVARLADRDRPGRRDERGRPRTSNGPR